MSLLFPLKLSLSATSFGSKLLGEKRITRTDAIISKRLRRFEYDYDSVKQLRDDNRGRVLSLQRAVSRVEQRDLGSYEKKTMADIHKYEFALRRQAKDVVKIILYLKKLIENEDLEILYDVRNPLVAFEEYTNNMSRILKGLRLEKHASDEIKNIMNSIQNTYEELINHTISYIAGTFQDFSNIGLDFDKMVMKAESEYTLDRHLYQRSVLKKQINGKTQWIISQIKRLEDILRGLKAKASIDKDFGSHLIENVSYFRGQFGELMSFCLLRVDASAHMIAEAVIMQKDNYKRLEQIKQELHQFYEQFLAEQQKAWQDNKSSYKAGLAGGRIKKYENYKDDIKGEFANFDKSFERKIVSIEKKDVKDLMIERIEQKSVVSKLGGFKMKMKKLAAATLIVLATTVGVGVVNRAGSAFQREAAIVQKEYGFKVSQNFLNYVLYYKNEAVSVTRSGTSFNITFNRPGVNLDLLEDNALIKIKKVIESKTLCGYKMIVKEQFKIQSLKKDSSLRISLDKSTVNIYAKDVIIIDGPNEIICSGSKATVKAIKEVNLDFSGTNLSKFVHVVDEQGIVKESVALIDNAHLPDVAVPLRYQKEGLNPSSVYEAFQSLKGRGTYWGPSGVSDGDSYNLVCNCVMRSGYYTMFGKRFIDDAGKSIGYGNLRSNVAWVSYFKKKGAFVDIEKQNVTLNEFNDWARKNNVELRPGMAIQLKHESGGRTIYHSIIIGKVSNGKVKSVFSAETGESISTIVGHVVGTLSSGQGYVSEIPAGRYFKPRTHHIVQGVVDIYRLRF